MTDPFIDLINRYAPNPKVILDIGALDCAQSRFFTEQLPNTRVVAFEPSPDNVGLCRESGIELVEKVALDYTGQTDFYAIKPGTNSGASSIYEPLGEILPWDEKPVYSRITIPCTRIDDWAREADVKQIDAVWMDVQGAELKVLKGFGSLLDKVSVIATEVETSPVYHGDPVQFAELSKFMFEHDFVLVDYKQAWEKEADLLYVKWRLL